MSLVWSKIAKIYLNDWRHQHIVPISQFAILEQSLTIKSWKDLALVKNTIQANPDLSGILYFLYQENFCPLPVVLEVAILNDQWNLVIKLAESADIQFCYLGKKTKYHLHEVIFSRFLDLIQSGNFPAEDFYKIVHLKIKKKYIGNSLFYKLKQIFSEEIKNCRTDSGMGILSGLLSNLMEFSFFLWEQGLLHEDFFNFLIKEAVKYKNLYVLRYLEPYLTEELPYLVLASLKSNFIEQVQEAFPQHFQPKEYLKYVIKCYFENPMADESELYRIINWLKAHSLDPFRMDNSILPIIICANFHPPSRIVLINHLITLKVVSKNKYLLDNLRNVPRVNPIIFEILASGDSIVDITENLLGCKSFAKISWVENVLENLQETRNQNLILFLYLTIGKLKINRDIVFNHLEALPELRSLKMNSVYQLIGILSNYKSSRQLKLLKSISSDQEEKIQNVFELMNIIKNNNSVGIKIPLKPRSFDSLDVELTPYKKIIQSSNINLGLDLFADEFEKLKFKDFVIKVPRTAQDLRNVGLKFKNCLAFDRHSKYVNDIILKNLIVFTLENEEFTYCVSFDPFNRKIVEAKKKGQELMLEGTRQSLDFFLKDYDFGCPWL